ncbi:MAG: metalloregulator ArsR/SmtB family transcription factor [Burkholderiales bacterium]|nr:metalloregulator ArsR/SmtB family transcription factor [Burkholderiales bacterium]
MAEEDAARMLAALGSAVRLRLFKALLRAGQAGMNVSDLQRDLGIPASTLAHHLGTIADAGLIAQERRGRELICTARYDQIRKVSAYLMAECCTGAGC